MFEDVMNLTAGIAAQQSAERAAERWDPTESINRFRRVVARIYHVTDVGNVWPKGHRS